MIELIHVSKIYNKNKKNEILAVNDLSLHIKKGDMISITGPSGSGKSTLLGIISFLTNITTGEYRYNGENANNFSDSKRAFLRNKTFGVILQDYGLIDGVNVIDNICISADIAGIRRRASESKADQLMKELGIFEYKKAKIGDLSGGEKQRVAIARALITDADIILADEPTGALDVNNKKQIVNIFKKLNDQGKAIICATHDQAVANEFTKQISLSDGKIEEQ